MQTTDKAREDETITPQNSPFAPMVDGAAKEIEIEKNKKIASPPDEAVNTETGSHEPFPEWRIPKANFKMGQTLYAKKCLLCHGRKGDGKGPAGRYAIPLPRDFTRGVFKIRSTPTGTVPTDHDLFNIITQGMPGTSMPGWGGLPEADRWQLIHYIKTFSKKFKEQETDPPIHIGPAPPVTEFTVGKGKEIYKAFECGKCHGNGGRGDGPSSMTLKDTQGRPIWPFDMTRGKKLKAGKEARDIYKVIMTGLDGTPMPSYEGSIEEIEAWYLAHYIKSLFLDQ